MDAVSNAFSSRLVSKFDDSSNNYQLATLLPLPPIFWKISIANLSEWSKIQIYKSVISEKMLKTVNSAIYHVRLMLREPSSSSSSDISS